MRKLNILKTILDFFWIFSLTVLVATIAFLPFYLFSSDMDIAIKIKGQEIHNQNIFTKVMVFIYVFSSTIFLYSIYLLRKVVILFQNREIFNAEVVRLFNLIGKLIVVSTIINSVTLFVYNMVKRKNIGLSLDFGNYDSFLVSVSIGLFFMVISEIFKIAMNIKEESELII